MGFEIHAYTHGDPVTLDRIFAKMLSRFLNICWNGIREDPSYPLRYFKYSRIIAPFTSLASLATFVTATSIKENIVANGLAIDVLIGGLYLTHGLSKKVTDASGIKDLVHFAKERFCYPFHFNELREVFTDVKLINPELLIHDELKKSKGKDLLQRWDYFILMNRVRNWTSVGSYSHLMLGKLPLTPGLSEYVFTSILKVDPTIRFYRHLEKEIIRRCIENIFLKLIPYANDLSPVIISTRITYPLIRMLKPLGIRHSYDVRSKNVAKCVSKLITLLYDYLEKAGVDATVNYDAVQKIIFRALLGSKTDTLKLLLLASYLTVLYHLTLT